MAELSDIGRLLRAFLLLSALFILLLFYPNLTIRAEDIDHHQYYSGYAGSLPSNPRNLTRTYFENPNLQNLIREIADRGPVSAKRVHQALSGTAYTVDDLLRVKLLRQDGQLFRIGFNFFTAADMQLVASAAEKYVPSLVQGYLASKEKFARIFSHYPIKSVDSDKVAFVLIAGFSLNWDALRITEKTALRKPLMVEGDGWKYTFWASEELPNHDIHGFYWGSSTFPAGHFNFPTDPANYSFSSYGDPYSDPRMNFPDFFTLALEEMQPNVRKRAESVGLVHETMLGLDLKDVLGLEMARDVAAILFALRQGAKNEAALVASVQTKRSIGATLSLLEEIQYIRQDSQGRYSLMIPVLDNQDKVMVDESLNASEQILKQWLAECYPKLRKDLGVLSSMRQGIPFESLFTQIWHELFGLATRNLVRSGLLFDPSAESVRYKGSFPVLWRTPLYNLTQE